MKKLSLFIVSLLCSIAASAQWRAGVTLGATSSSLVLDKQYQYDWRYKHRWGMEIGAVGQYNFNEWLGVRTELTYVQRGYRQYRTGNNAGTDYKYRNNYLQLPVMASFSFGGSRLRGFVNAGVYGGYWLNGRVKGSFYDLMEPMKKDLEQDVELNSTRDKRWDFGYVGGLGLEYKCCDHIAAQLECRYYYSVTSITKDYMHNKDYRYYNSIGVQATVFYLF